MRGDRRAFIRTAGGVALLPFARRARAEAPRVIKFSHVVAADTPKGRGVEFFARTLEERTHGRLKVEVYPNSALYKDKEELEALQLGAVQMLAPSLSKFGPIGVKQFELFDLPYLFPNEAAFARVTRGPIGSELFSLLESRGAHGLAFWSAGFHVYSSNRPVRLPGDLRGQKMRIPSSKVLEASLHALGALPQILAFGDVYQALETGVVDGTENIPSSYTSQRWYEVQKHLALTNHTHTGYGVIINKVFWDGLSPELQSITNDVMRLAGDQEGALVVRENVEAINTMRASGKTEVLELSDVEGTAWRTALLPVHDEMAPRIGADLLRRVHQAATG
jgi:C4-dicarboxylate-binding protein DctP